MADKILMNKNTLAALKLDLVEYKDSLPIFEMKEQQLVGLVRTLEQDISRLNEDIANTNKMIQSWVSVMAERDINLSDFLKTERVISTKKEVVGVTVEKFEDIIFEEVVIDLLTTPLWLDSAIEAVTEQVKKRAAVAFKEKEIALLENELAEARRLKNALKEVFIPETIVNIRKIEIYLGDVERLAIGCAKLVKKKKVQKELQYDR